MLCRFWMILLLISTQRFQPICWTVFFRMTQFRHNHFCRHLLTRLTASVSPDEVTRLIMQTSSKKAPGPDHITNTMLKKSQEIIAVPLAHLFIHCLKMGHFPSCWKRAQLVIFSKPGKSDYHVADSYRPISLISSISKLLEKVINNRLVAHLEDRQIISQSQHGFTKSSNSTINHHH